MRNLFARKRKNTLILESLATDIQYIERTARIMNARHSLFDQFQLNKPFKTKELYSDEERRIVTHMCIRLTDKLSNNDTAEFIRLRFYRFICMILEDLDLVQSDLENMAKSVFVNREVRSLARKYAASLLDHRNNLVVGSTFKLDKEFKDTIHNDRIKFQYDVPTAFLLVYGLARQIAFPFNLTKYETVMPELMQLMTEDC